MNRLSRNIYWLKSLKRSSGLVFLIANIVCAIIWLYLFGTIIVQKRLISSCHRVNIYGRSGQKRCYPLLVNFGHICCKQSQKDNCETGLAFGIRQCVKLHMDIFESDVGFRQRNRDILSRDRGAGYWLWKPYIIWHELYVAREGDIIIYSDAGVNFTAHIDILLDFMTNQDILMFRQTNHSESAYTKRDAFILTNTDHPDYVHSMASVASYIFVRKSIKSLAFVSEWLTYSQDSRAVTDDSNVLGHQNYGGFIEHRHDQAILGLLSKKWNLTTYTDPSHWGENYTRPFPTIFQHHRYKH